MFAGKQPVFFSPVIFFGAYSLISSVTFVIRYMLVEYGTFQMPCFTFAEQ